MTVYSPKKHQSDSSYLLATNTKEQPVPSQSPSLSPSNEPWSTGLFDCFDDYKSCCLTLWCPCVSVGRVTEIVNEGVVSCRSSGTLYTLLIFVCGCTCCYTAWNRSKLRTRYSLEGQHCNDCLTHCLCEECAMCQEYRELENRGYIMSLGWKGNVERHRQMMMAMRQPAVQWGMVR